MKYALLLVASAWINGIHAFNVTGPVATASSFGKLSTALLASSPESDQSQSNEKPDLVDQKIFISAIETINEAAGVGIDSSTPAGMHTRLTPGTDIRYAIGRLEVTLNIPPGIDLVETPNLVLINGVDQSALDAGVQPLDTIVGVSATTGTDGDYTNTKGSGMDDMFAIIKAAIDQARINGSMEIRLELNRLVKGYYK